MEEGNEKFQKCKECIYGKAIEDYWKEEYIGKKATIILQTMTTTLILLSAIINTILLFKK